MTKFSVTAEDWAQYLFSVSDVSEKLHTVVKHDQERSEWGSLHVGSEIEGYTFKLFLWKWNFNFLSQFVRSIWAY